MRRWGCWRRRNELFGKDGRKVVLQSNWELAFLKSDTFVGATYGSIRTGISLKKTCFNDFVST